MAHRIASQFRLQSTLALAIGVAALYFMRDVFIPIVFALLLAFLLAPITDGLQKLRLGRIVSALITLVLAFALLALFTGVVVRELVDVAGGFTNYQQSIQKRVQHMPGTRAIANVTRGIQAITRSFSNLDTNQEGQPAHPGKRQTVPPVSQSAPPEAVPGGSFALIRNLITPLVGPLGQTAIVLIFTTFILLNKQDVRNRFIRLAGLGRIGVTTLALDDAGNRVGRYLRFALLINSSFGGLITIGLLLIGLPYAALWGIIAGLMRFIPYFGILISCSAPLLLSLAVFTGWVKTGLVLLLFFVLEAVAGNVLEPIVYGANTGTSPLGLLVAAVFWTVLWGPVGLVLSTPVTVCLVVFGRYFPQLSILHVLLAEEPALTDPTRLYQRLLATDREESKTIIDEALKEGSLVELYDELLIPALKLAEQDRHKGSLQAERSDYIFLTLNDMIREIENQSAGEEGAGGTPLQFEPAADCRQQIACMGVMDEADELCATMLAQVLHRYGCHCVHFPSDWIHELREDTDDIIILSAVPPFALVSARSYCARIRRRCPSSTIVVGMWGYASDPEKIKARFGPAKPDHVITRFAQALELVKAAEGNTAKGGAG